MSTPAGFLTGVVVGASVTAVLRGRITRAVPAVPLVPAPRHRVEPPGAPAPAPAPVRDQYGRFTRRGAA